MKFCTKCNKVVDFDNVLFHIEHPITEKTFEDIYRYVARSQYNRSVNEKV